MIQVSGQLFVEHSEFSVLVGADAPYTGAAKAVHLTGSLVGRARASLSSSRFDGSFSRSARALPRRHSATDRWSREGDERRTERRRSSKRAAAARSPGWARTTPVPRTGVRIDRRIHLKERRVVCHLQTGPDAVLTAMVADVVERPIEGEPACERTYPIGDDDLCAAAA